MPICNGNETKLNETQSLVMSRRELNINDERCDRINFLAEGMSKVVVCHFVNAAHHVTSLTSH